MAPTPNAAAPTNHIGECSECGNPGTCRNIYKTHMFFCDEHRLTWSPGINLMSSWREENLEDWHEAWEHVKRYRTVVGYGEYAPSLPLDEQVDVEYFVPAGWEMGGHDWERGVAVGSATSTNPPSRSHRTLRAGVLASLGSGPSLCPMP